MNEQTIQQEADIVSDEEKLRDEIAAGMFQAMGYARFSDNLIRVYREFKRRKDILQPGRPSAEAMAFVSILADMADGTFKLDQSE